MKNITLETNWGKDFHEMCKEAQSKAIEIRNKEFNYAIQVPLVEFEFNGINCVVSYNTNLEYLLRDYHNAHTMKWDTIGPDCVKEYDASIIQELKKRTIAVEKRAKELSKKYKLEAEQKESKLREKIKGIEFECSDDENFQGWDKSNKDPYGGRVISYAKEWAMLMQVEMAEGKKLKDIAEKTSREADYDGITGFMYGAAVQMLSQCWSHGEDLRKWHNKEYDHEGDGVVNPALLTIKSK